MLLPVGTIAQRRALLGPSTRSRARPNCSCPSASRSLAIAMFAPRSAPGKFRRNGARQHEVALRPKVIGASFDGRLDYLAVEDVADADDPVAALTRGQRDARGPRQAARPPA